MWIDLIFLLLLIAGVYKGARKGIIMSVFTFAGWIVGLAAALTLSGFVAGAMQNHTNINSRWLPALSFLIVFTITALLIRSAGKLVENILDLSLLNWVNRLGGALVYAGLYVLLGSVLLFFMEKLHLINTETLSASRAHGLTEGLVPALLEGLGTFMPTLKNTFQGLQDFFEGAEKSILQSK
ncbi:MAG: CvpA family protein [Chitinophagaceae bacterium]|nr:CvpA family protein [Chitinophagaceae bacterium]